MAASSGLGAQQPLSKFDQHPYDGPINFRALFWVDRGPGVWALQTTIAVICFVEALLMQYLTYKVCIGGPVSGFRSAAHSLGLELTRRPRVVSTTTE